MNEWMNEYVDQRTRVVETSKSARAHDLIDRWSQFVFRACVSKRKVDNEHFTAPLAYLQKPQG